MKKTMEHEMEVGMMGYIEVILGLSRGSRKEHGNYGNILG